MPEIEFEKYKKYGAYHWKLASLHPAKGNAFVRANYVNCIKFLESQTDSLKGKKILDFGCGDGMLTYKICMSGALGFGIDLSEYAIELAIEKHRLLNTNAKFIVGSCYRTPFDDNSFDSVISCDAIEHVQDTNQFLSEIQRILKPDGIAIISTPIRLAKNPLDSMHVKEWFVEEFKEIIIKVFPKSQFYVSHPVFWIEFMNRSRWHMVIMNIISIFYNPFLNRAKWRHFAMQYAVCMKKIYNEDNRKELSYVHKTLKK